MSRKIVAANWKMHGDLSAIRDRIETLLRYSESEAELILFPSFVYLNELAERLAGSIYSLGAQTVSEYDEGAYTGEISASMLKEYDCEWVLIGHSERRQYFHETGSVLREKLNQAFSNGLNVIYCVGETQEAYESHETNQVIESQLSTVLSQMSQVKLSSKLVIAYEPVWAIGTGLSATPEYASEVHGFIRRAIAQFDKNLSSLTPIIYGGSVKPDNAKSLFSMQDIDGALVGGASLDAAKFIEIIECIK